MNLNWVKFHSSWDKNKFEINGKVEKNLKLNIKNTLCTI